MSTPTIEAYLKVADSKALEVLLWLLHNRDGENIINTTLDKVAEDCDVTKVTVNRVFQKLYAQEYLVKIRNGQYKLMRV
jgi:DNA-binding IscR family transcriptional regulator